MGEDGVGLCANIFYWRKCILYIRVITFIFHLFGRYLRLLKGAQLATTQRLQRRSPTGKCGLCVDSNWSKLRKVPNRVHFFLCWATRYDSLPSLVPACYCDVYRRFVFLSLFSRSRAEHLLSLTSSEIYRHWWVRDVWAWSFPSSLGYRWFIYWYSILIQTHLSRQWR